MSEGGGNGERHGPDLLGVVLLGLLALGAVGGAAWLVEIREFTASGLVLALVIGGALVFAHHGLPKAAPPKNTQVHGAARAASEQEARRAARGEAQGARLDDREF